jgi:hypothetical protein
MGWLFTRQASEGTEAGYCGICRHFRNDPAYLETVFRGLTSFSSAHASVRGDDGLCVRHDRYLGAGFYCADFSPVEEP